MKISLPHVLAYFTAYCLNAILHESGHALTAWLLGLRAILFHWYVNIDYTGADSSERALCAIAGPVFSLCLGLLFWAAYKRERGRSAGLLLLYCSITAVSMFLGNLFSTAFVGGDFGVAAAQMNLPGWLRLAMTVAGGLLLAAFLYRMGRELSRGGTTMQVIVWPVVVGTAAAIVAFLPMPASFIAGWIAASSFWVFAAAGSLMARERTSLSSVSVTGLDAIAAMVALLAVRVLVSGVSLRR